MHATAHLYRSKHLSKQPEFACVPALCLPMDMVKNVVELVVTGGSHTQERMAKSGLSASSDVTCRFCGQAVDNTMHAWKCHWFEPLRTSCRKL